MQPLRHAFPPAWLWRGYTLLCESLSVGLPVLILAGPIIAAVSAGRPVTVIGVLNLLLLAALTFVCFALAAHFFTELTSDQAGLHVRFLWRRLVVPWDQIVDVRPVFKLPFARGLQVIRTRALTPFHRVYGLMYGFTTAPSLLISPGMSHGAELSQRLTAYVEKNRRARRRAGLKG
ncbi:MAG: hypothetical protein IT317_10265 [Anaerolineales bacterium]|nr:hypothetical protein [Anaerolineales bacterium]